MTGPETDPDQEAEFDSIEERLAFAEIALAAGIATPPPDAREKPPEDDPWAAFPD